MEKNIYLFRNRYFTPEELSQIHDIINQHWSSGRKKIATIICEKLNWRALNGHLKVIPCLEALRKMEKQGLITLPPSKSQGGYHKIKPIKPQQINFKEPNEKITGTIRQSDTLHFELAKTKTQNDLWRYLIQRYHYLGYTRAVGRHLKYFVYWGAKLVALISFSDGIYHHHLRDEWLGWDKDKERAQRHLIINNNRFLILPWVEIKNLGSKILSTAARVVSEDWFLRYGYRPLVIETFVETKRFKGTVYKAANWQLLGKTSGKGRCGARYFFHGNPKDYYVYLLRGD